MNDAERSATPPGRRRGVSKVMLLEPDLSALLQRHPELGVERLCLCAARALRPRDC